MTADIPLEILGKAYVVLPGRPAGLRAPGSWLRRSRLQGAAERPLWWWDKWEVSEHLERGLGESADAGLAAPSGVYLGFSAGC